MTHSDDLILGVDGGGSKTLAWLAAGSSPARVIGRGSSGPANCRSVGLQVATANLRRAVAAAFEDAGQGREQVASVCLALAGADRQQEQQQFRLWAESQQLARRITITNDAIPIVYAASCDGVGIGLIAGTGSIAISRNDDREVTRCGGWGGLFGDEGSGYKIAVAGLRAAARAADGRGPETALFALTLDHFKIVRAAELIEVIYQEDTNRSTIARFAPIVFQAAQAGDSVAKRIIDRAADSLSELVTTLATRSSIARDPIPLGLAGGVLINQPAFTEDILSRLRASQVNIAATRVPDPVAGAITIAIAMKRVE